MKATTALKILNEITSFQWGMVTTAQAAQRGVTRLRLSRLAESGHLERLEHGIYRAAGAPTNRFDSIKVAWLSINPQILPEQRLLARPPDAVVSGAAASYLLGWGDLVPEPYEFTVPSRRQTQRTELIFRVKKLDAANITICDGLPVTRLEQTIADLIEARYDRSLVADVLSDAPIYDRDQLSDLLTRLAPRNGFRSGKDFLYYLERLAHRDPESQAKLITASPIGSQVIKYLRQLPDEKGRDYG